MGPFSQVTQFLAGKRDTFVIICDNSRKDVKYATPPQIRNPIEAVAEDIHVTSSFSCFRYKIVGIFAGHLQSFHADIVLAPTSMISVCTHGLYRT